MDYYYFYVLCDCQYSTYRESLKYFLPAHQQMSKKYEVKLYPHTLIKTLSSITVSNTLQTEVEESGLLSLNLSSTTLYLFFICKSKHFQLSGWKEKNQLYQWTESLGSPSLDCFSFLEQNQYKLNLLEIWEVFKDETIHTPEHLDNASGCLESVQIWSRVVLGAGAEGHAKTPCVCLWRERRSCPPALLPQAGCRTIGLVRKGTLF